MQDRKRWFQMRLSTLLILMCFLGAVIAPFANNYVRHQQAITWLELSGGYVTDWHQGWFYDSPKKLRIYGAIDNLKPIREFSELTSLEVVPMAQQPPLGRSITGQRVPIGRSTTVLIIPQAKINDLTAIENLTKLTYLSIMTTERVVLPSGARLKELKTIKVGSPHRLDPSPLKTFQSLDKIHLNLLVEVPYDQQDNFDTAGTESGLASSVQNELEELKRQFPNAMIEYRPSFLFH